MAGLVIQLYGDHIRVILVGEFCIWIDVTEELAQVILLGPDGCVIDGGPALSENPGKPGCLLVSFRVSVAPKGDWSQDDTDITLFQFRQQEIEQPQVLIVQKIPKRIGNFGIPDMDPEGIEPKPRQMIDILPDGLPGVYPQRLVGPVRIGERNGIVHTPEGGFGIIFRPPEDALLVDKY